MKVSGTYRDRVLRQAAKTVVRYLDDDGRELVWGSMIYACTDPPEPSRPVPPSWDNIVAKAPEGYWAARGGVPKTIVVNGVECFPPKAGGCGHEERYYLCVGVEGPPERRERDAYIPCPFIAGSCPQCGLPMKHERWNEDETFDDLRPVPDGARYFRIPDEKLAAEFLRDAAYGGAELVDPHPWSSET